MTRPPLAGIERGDHAWAVKCPTCGATPGRPCYGNGALPRHMTHSPRAAAANEALTAAVRDVLAECERFRFRGRGAPDDMPTEFDEGADTVATAILRAIAAHLDLTDPEGGTLMTRTITTDAAADQALAALVEVAKIGLPLEERRMVDEHAAQIRAALTVPSVVPEAAVEAFKAAWHKADAEGRTGERVSGGLAAALPLLTAAAAAAVEARPAPAWDEEAVRADALDAATATVRMVLADAPGASADVIARNVTRAVLAVVLPLLTAAPKED